ncbi:hypothetical protein WICPIJ_001040 [Wickerhamomyces pijperi]|uniref:Uncharacterized protein n=1 Tax=Wickerhamomyces pijperi TaxID=599730 RepID=A0A9P8TQA3_WICPI|nr:hypothetical protein WICPIJ_001040 [Wickerhamomyces pijperi]
METLGGFGWLISLKTKGDEIWYGVFEMQMSKYGNSVFMKSPNMISNFFSTGVPWTLLVNSAPILGSISTATTFLACSKIRTVKLPVPGPTSNTISDGLICALSTIP